MLRATTPFVVLTLCVLGAMAESQGLLDDECSISTTALPTHSHLTIQPQPTHSHHQLTNHPKLIPHCVSTSISPPSSDYFYLLLVSLFFLFSSLLGVFFFFVFVCLVFSALLLSGFESPYRLRVPLESTDSGVHGLTLTLYDGPENEHAWFISTNRDEGTTTVSYVRSTSPPPTPRSLPTKTTTMMTLLLEGIRAVEIRDAVF